MLSPFDITNREDIPSAGIDPGTNEPKRNVVLIVYDRMNDSVKAQVVRDFLILAGSFAVSFKDDKGLMDAGILDAIGVTKAIPKSPISLIIVYKVGSEWPEYDRTTTHVERDLSPMDNGQKLDGEPRIGYYLKPQGRSGANLTLRYLNRAYPKGKGFVYPWFLN